MNRGSSTAKVRRTRLERRELSAKVTGGNRTDREFPFEFFGKFLVAGGDDVPGSAFVDKVGDASTTDRNKVAHLVTFVETISKGVSPGRPLKF